MSSQPKKKRKILSDVDDYDDTNLNAVNVLHTYALGEIFIWLSASDLKECSLVCKTWHELIGSSAELMQKFKNIFCLTSDGLSVEEKFDKIKKKRKAKSQRKFVVNNSFESQRKLRHIEIIVCDKKLMHLSRLDSFEVSRVQTLKLDLLHGYSPSPVEINFDLNRVVSLLSKLPRLETLEILFEHFYPLFRKNNETVSLKRLKQLKIHNRKGSSISFAPILKHIKAENITDLWIGDHRETIQRDVDFVAEFINSLKNLQELRLPLDMSEKILSHHSLKNQRLKELMITI